MSAWSDRATRWLGVVLACCAIGCGTGEGETNPVTTGFVFEAGRFDMRIHEVDDQCLDGALELFVELAVDCNAIHHCWMELPTWDLLPWTYAIDLLEGFEDLVVVVLDDGPAGMRWENAVLEDIVLKDDETGRCTFDTTVDGKVLLQDNDHIQMVTTVHITGWEGDCPTPSSDRCPVIISYLGVRNMWVDWLGE